MPNRINQGNSFNYAQITIKENKKNSIDKKISGLEGRIQNLNSRLENGNTIIKIKAFVALAFLNKDLDRLKKASISLGDDIKRLTAQVLPPTLTIQELSQSAISEQLDRLRLPSDIDDGLESGSEGEALDEPLSTKPTTNGYENIKTSKEDELTIKRDKVFSETMLYQRGGTYTSMQNFLPAKEPKESVSPDPVLKQKWVEAHTGEFRTIAEILIDKINHVTHEEFKSQLKESVENFNNYLSGQSDPSYIIVIPGGFDKSALWVTSLAKEFLEFPPERIIMIHDYDFADILEESTCVNIVMFDDAAYSGRQMAEEYFPKFEGVDKVLHPIIPFMTESAEKKLEVELTKLNIKHMIHDHATMDSFSKFLSERQKKLLRAEGNNEFTVQQIDTKTNPSGIDNLTVTYFDHKKADDWSMVTALDDGSSLNSSSEKIQFIPDVTSPYKPKKN
jgi:hypothetical protein